MPSPSPSYGVVVASQTGGARTFDVVGTPPSNEGVIGIINSENSLLRKKLALSSVQSEMPQNVQTTDKPVVVMVAPRQILTNRKTNLPIQKPGGGSGNGAKNGEETKISKQLEKVQFK